MRRRSLYSLLALVAVLAVVQVGLAEDAAEEDISDVRAARLQAGAWPRLTPARCRTSWQA